MTFFSLFFVCKFSDFFLFVLAPRYRQVSVCVTWRNRVFWKLDEHCTEQDSRPSLAGTTILTAASQLLSCTISELWLRIHIFLPFPFDHIFQLWHILLKKIESQRFAGSHKNLHLFETKYTTKTGYSFSSIAKPMRSFLVMMPATLKSSSTTTRCLRPRRRKML